MQTSLGVLVQVARRDGLSVATDIAIVILAVAVILLAALCAFLLLRLRSGLGELRIGIRQNLGPVSDRARSISDNVEFITQALRTDVERLNASVHSLTERLHQASDRMEERIEEFNALMEVVQDEAEHIFIDTAATVRGVRAGARSIRARSGAEGNESSSPERVARRGASVPPAEETQTLAADEP